MIPDLDLEPVVLANGDQFAVRLLDSLDSEPTRRGVALERQRHGQVVERVALPFPGAGFGGGGLTLSPSEELLLFSFYSGQSEEAYRVFSIDGATRELCSCEYLLGEAASYAFSPREDFLVMALPASCSEWWQPWDDDEAEVDEDGRRYLEFCLIRIHDIRRDVATHHIVRVYPRADWQPTRDDYDPDLRPTIDAAGRLMLQFPWGPLLLTQPLPEVVAITL